MSPLRHIRALPVNLEKDWHELFSSFWSAWSTPRQAAMAATFPHIGEGGAKEATSFAMKKAQYLDFAKTGPGQQWIKLVDKEKAPSSIIGGLCLTHWKDAQKPKNVPKLAEVKQASQQPQMITQQLYGQLDVWHSQVMQSREHIYGHAVWVLPEYRRLGAGRLLADAFADLLDENDLEGYGECVRMSKGLFEKVGFVVVDKVHVNMQIEKPGVESQWLVDEFRSDPLHLIWRPKKSDRNAIRPKI